VVVVEVVGEVHREVVGAEGVIKVVVVTETLQVALEEVEVAQEVLEAAVALVETTETGPVVPRDSLRETGLAAL